METLKMFIAVILCLFGTWILFIVAVAITKPVFPQGIVNIDKTAWDCSYYAATQKYENTGWECLNRSNHDLRVDNLQTREY